MLWVKILINIVFLSFVLIVTGCSTSAIHTAAQVDSIEDFRSRVSQLEAGDEIDIMTVKREDFELEVTEVGSDYVEGYAYYAGSPAAEWWPTRHYFKDIKMLDGIMVPADAFPTLSATKKEIVDDGDDSQDLSRFQVGSEVQIVTVEGKTIQMTVAEANDDLIRGIISSSNQDAGDEVEFLKTQIAVIKYVEIGKGKAVEKVLVAILKGIGYTIVMVLYLAAEIAASM